MGKQVKAPNAPAPQSAGQKFEASFTVAGLDHKEMERLFVAWVKLVDKPSEWLRKSSKNFGERRNKGKVTITGAFWEIPPRKEAPK